MLHNYDITIEKKNDLFFLIFDGSPIRTGDGSYDVCHSNSRLLEHMIEEFLGFGSIAVNDKNIIEPIMFSAYAIFSDQKKIFSKNDPYLDKVAEFAFKEPCLQTVAGPERVEQLAAYDPFLNFLSDFLGKDFKALREASSKYYMESIGGEKTDEKEIQKFSKTECAEKLREFYNSFSIYEKAAIHGLFCMDGGKTFLLPMVLLKGGISKNQYASALTASGAYMHEVFGDIDRSEYQHYFDSILSSIEKALDYVKFYTDSPEKDKSPEEIVLHEIQNGETAKCEFKSSLRWNLKTQMNDKKMTYACLKTLAGFLNTHGGTLYIGVSDEGKTLGIKHDNYKNNDQFLNNLFNFIDDALGKHAAALINAEIVTIENKSICKVECPKSINPAYLKWDKTEELFVRTGPSTRSLAASEIADYIHSHFSSKK